MHFDLRYFQFTVGLWDINHNKSRKIYIPLFSPLSFPPLSPFLFTCQPLCYLLVVAVVVLVQLVVNQARDQVFNKNLVGVTILLGEKLQSKFLRHSNTDTL